MKVYLIMAVILIAVYLVFYKYKGLKTKQEIIQENKELRKKDKHNFLSAEHSILTTLNNIENSEKVTLDEVTEKWSLNKNTIDANLNSRVICFLNKTIQNLGILTLKDFYIHTIENIYVMKDSEKNFRIVGDTFVQDVPGFYTFRLLFDFVSLNDDVYINYIDIDESSVNNILDRYNVKWNSQGILDNFSNFDQGVISILDNHYKSNTKLLKVTKDTEDDVFDKTTRLVKFYSDPTKPSVEFPIFCKKHKGEWGYDGVYFENTKDCMFHNPYSTSYPNQPYRAPGVVTGRTDSNQYDWLYKPERSNHLRN